MKETISLHSLRISLAKPDFSKRLMHGLEKLFGRSINTWFVFSSDFRYFCRVDQFYILIGNQALRVTYMDEVCKSINLHLNHIILGINNTFFNYVTNFFRFMISKTLFLIKSKSSTCDWSESWQSFPSKWICEIIPTSAWYICFQENTASIFRNGLEGLFTR